MRTLSPEISELKQEPYYLPFSRLMKRLFGEPAYKLTLDVGFTCPNIDGTRATGGCTFCDNTSFSPALRTGISRIPEQLAKGQEFYKERFGATKFLAYFQTFTNTYAPVERLRDLYDEALLQPGIVGMAIGTRPDCIDSEKLALLQSYADGSAEVFSHPDYNGSERPFVCVEYGMQTMHDVTADRVNRAHSHAETVEACELTRVYAPDVHLCLHLIAGLPGEDDEMIRASIAECARLAPDSVKFHHCYVYENTKMAEQYRAGEFEVIDLETHVRLAVDCIEQMPPHTCIQRLVGEMSDPGVIAPQWPQSKMQVYQMIRDELKHRGTHQAAKYRA